MDNHDSNEKKEPESNQSMKEKTKVRGGGAIIMTIQIILFIVYRRKMVLKIRVIRGKR